MAPTQVRSDAAVALPRDAFASGAPRRAKVLPEHARAHNRTLVLQTLLDDGPSSRADLARATSLTRVTVSDLVAELVAEGLLVELGTREDSRPGKPATLVDLARDAFLIVGLDLSDAAAFRGALLAIDGTVLDRAELPTRGAAGEEALALAIDLARTLRDRAATRVLGVGVGTPGVVDVDGVVLQAPNLDWHDLPLRDRLVDALGVPVHVANDANAALLAERGRSNADLLVVRIGLGVGAGLAVGGVPVRGTRSAAGEIGHVTIGTDGGPRCACGRDGCLEAWLAEPRLRHALAVADASDHDRILDEAGHRLGIALAPIVGVLDLPRVIVSGPADLLDGPLARAAERTLRERTLDDGQEVVVAMTVHGDDVVARGAAMLVRSGELGVA